MKKLFLLLLVLFLVPTVPVKADTKKDLELKNKLIKLFKSEIDKSEVTEIEFDYSYGQKANINIDNKINAYASLKSHKLTYIRVPAKYKVDKKLVKGMQKEDYDVATVYTRGTDKPYRGIAKPDKHLIKTLFNDIKVPLIQKKALHNKLLKQTERYVFGFHIYPNVETPYFVAYDKDNNLIFSINYAQREVTNITFSVNKQKDIKKSVKLLLNKDLTKAYKTKSGDTTVYAYKTQDIIVTKFMGRYVVSFVDQKGG